MKNIDGKSNAIATQLCGIKIALLLIAACSVVAAASNIYFVVDRARANNERRLNEPFRQKAERLNEDERWDELLKLSLAYKETYPHASLSFYYSGIAHLNKGEFDEAESDFKRTVELAPESKTSIDKWLKSLEERRKGAAKK